MNIQQACTLCHGAALTSCLDCHAEVVNFTLDCTSCHGLPPTVSHATINAAGPTVADISEHDVCVVCHGMKESAAGGTFSNVADYALFDKLTDTIGDHWDGNINLNSDAGYNENTGGCDAALCHGGTAPYTLPDSGLPVVLGAYGAHSLDGSFLDADSHGPVAKADLTVCQVCHSDNPTGGPGSNPRFNVGIDSQGSIGCEACHAPFYAHPDSWAGPLPNTRYHYSAGNIQQACTLCHGAALTSCLDCHAEVVNFTLDCTSCHGQPPTVSHATSPALTEPTVADIIAHDVCQTCHGMKESAAGGTFSNVADYALFDKQTDTIGDHWDGNINMNSDTGYNQNTGGCDNAGCHGGVAPYTLPLSGFPVVMGAYGAGVPHPVGQDWLLPTGHVAAADATCIACHTLAGGGLDPACQDCHIQGDPLVLLDCTSCHSAPPSTPSIDTLDRPDRQGAHNGHDGFTTSTQDCSACHQGGGTGELSHYDRVDQITPDYPADVVLAAGFNSNINGNATYNADITGGGTCSGVSCHGGLVTPNWLTESLDVDNDCTSCHSLGTSDRVNSEFNSYYSGEHNLHVVERGFLCTVCHNTTKLATSHFTNLVNPAQWLDTAGATIDGTTTGILGDPDGIVEGNYDEGTMACLPTCHGTETW